MNRERVKEDLRFFMQTTSGHNLHANIEKFLDEVELEHRKALRPFCVSFAQIAIAVIEQAHDTLWISQTETVIERIFNELALEIDMRDGTLVEHLKSYIEGNDILWQEKLKAAKSKEPVQLELNLRNET